MAMKSYTFNFESRIKPSPCVTYKEDSISKQISFICLGKFCEVANCVDKMKQWL